jgi:hypothetical protein
METKIEKGSRLLAFASIGAGLLPYVLVVVLLTVAAAVRYFGFHGMDVFVRSFAIICLCPIVGLWLGGMAFFRYARVGSSSREQRLSIAGLALNGLNGILLFVFSQFA